MINLLVPETKAQIRAAKLNTVLVNYIVILLSAILFLGVVYAAGYYLMSSAKVGAEKRIEESEQQASVYNDTRIAAQQLQTGLSEARSMIDSDVNYAKILTDLGTLTPKGVVIEKLALSSNSFTAPTPLQIYAETTDIGLAARDAFQSSSLFSSVTLGTMSSQDGIEGYPVSIELTVQFKRGSAL